MNPFALPRHDPLRPPPARGLGRGVALAVVAHALLLLALTAGLNWRSKTEPAFEAELWAAVPVAAAPREQAPPPTTESQPDPAPPKPAPEPPRPDPRQLAVEQREAELAMQREKDIKKKKQQTEQQLEREQQRQQQELKEKQAREDKLKAEKAEKAERAKQQEQQARLDAKKQEAALLEKQRQENLRRIQGMAGASGGPQATGTAQQSAGPSASYAGRIKARIRPNIIFSDSGPSNPVALAEVRAAPDGTILSRRLLKASGDLEWDKAVLRAIDKTEILPRDVNGRVPSTLEISFQPRE